MRLLILFLLVKHLFSSTAVWAQDASAVTAAKLDESEVRITYGELKRLLEAAKPPPPMTTVKPRPDLVAALMAASYRLDAAAGTLTAELRVENFDGGWHAVALMGAGTGAMAVEPTEARVVVFGDDLCLITDKPGIVNATLTFSLMPEGQGTVLTLARAAVASLQVAGIPEGKVLRVAHGDTELSLTKNGAAPLPAGGGEVRFTVEARSEKPPAATDPVTDDALISAATYTTEVVRDGAVLTEGSITVRHDMPARLALVFPEGAKLLQCHVNGEAVRPVADAEGRMEIPLDDPATDGAESEVKLSYTQSLPALQEAEGEITLALPQTPLFARQIDWTVRMPAGFDLTVSGNVDAAAEAEGAKAPAGGLRLRKSLCRDQQPQARITYRKR